MTVFLVGAGPGDPGLLTVRGAEVLARADVVVYDRLSVAYLLDRAPSGAELINVGKLPGKVTMSQEAICELLVDRGSTGRQVVRLKGGDPFVFARGGEEALALEAAGVPYEVVPGISSAIAAPAYAGIPVTMRHSATSFTVLTGHEDPDKDGELDWTAVAKLGGTIIVLMGAARIGKIASRLIEGGLSPDTPAAAVQWGTRPEQRTTRATLATLPDHDIEPPSTIVIGQVAAMQLDWYESQPLFGRKVIVTRAREQASALSAALLAQGARAVEVPTIEVLAPSDGGSALRQAVSEVQSYDWVVLTSANGARRLLDELHDARDLGGVKLAAIGSGTAEVLERANLRADLAPRDFVAESLLASFPGPSSGDAGRVLLARAAVARDVVPDGLRELGWAVDVVDAYRTVAAPVTDELREAAEGADAITFTSSSTVTNYLDTGMAIPPVVACIGPVTAATATDRGLKVDVVAEVHTIDGLVEALVAHLP